MNNTNTVLTFPLDRIVKPQEISTSQQVLQKIEDVHMYHVEESTEILVEKLMLQFEILGFNFDPDDESYQKNIFFMIESLRALMLKYYNMEHPFHQISEENFEQDEEGFFKLKETPDDNC